MQRFWFRIAPYWHLGAAIIWGCIITAWWVHDVSGYSGRIETVENKQNKQEKIITRMDYNVQIIARQVGVKPLEKGEDE